MHGDITFYRVSDRPYGAFSNLYRCDVLFEGEVYTTAEHAYQEGKPRRAAVREWLLAAPSPALLAMAAHGLYPWEVRGGWSQDKFERMRRVLMAKFDQHRNLGDLLVATGSRRLVETPTVENAANRLWGEVGGKGRNMLGVLLMETRERLRGQEVAR